MRNVKARTLELDGVRLVTHEFYPDERGFFADVFNTRELEFVGPIAQVNESFSHTFVVRGLHIQWDPAQGKLLRVTRGSILDIVLDLRCGSKTFGCAIAVAMNEQDDEWLWIPPGFAHGFYVEYDAHVEYLCTSRWSPHNEASITPLDENIMWKTARPPLERGFMSEKDHAGMTLDEWIASPNLEKFKL